MVIQVKVKTHAKEESVLLEKGVYYVSIRALPVENRANIAVINLLSEYFQIPKGHISIKSGLKSRKKLVEIVDL